VAERLFKCLIVGQARRLDGALLRKDQPNSGRLIVMLTKPRPPGSGIRDEQLRQFKGHYRSACQPAAVRRRDFGACRSSNILRRGAPSLGGVGSGLRAVAAFRIEQADPEVESLGRDHPISGRSRRGREEAPEVERRDGEEGASQAQAAKENLTRQIGRVRGVSAWRMPAGLGTNPR
jgi:hypothetical protein